MSDLDVRANAGGLQPTGAAQVSIVDILDRLLGTGVVLAGDVTISLAGVDLVDIRLNALITSVRADMARREWRAP
jgi:hypothetical protein